MARRFRSKRERAMYKQLATYGSSVRVRQATTHNYRREGDEYVCRCGKRWDVHEDDPHLLKELGK